MLSREEFDRVIGQVKAWDKKTFAWHAAVQQVVESHADLLARVEEMEKERDAARDKVDEQNTQLAKAAIHIADLERQLVQVKQEEREAYVDIDRKYRKLLWLGHGHLGIYGDDGEMQCAECIQYGCADYLRDPLSKVEAAAQSAKIVRMNEAIRQREGA